MKHHIITFGFLALGTAGMIIFTPKKKDKLRYISERIKKIQGKIKIEPEKLACC